MAATSDRGASSVSSLANAADQTQSLAQPLGEEVIAASSPFVGRWQTLVTTTNWEKGRIILDWRTALQKSGSPITDYSDEAWGALVGNVTGQHVGRLRRVHERFGEVQTEYEGLYWSHFQAAIDWQDAEMWLEGAVQNDWSISQMRAKRWETVGDGSPPPAEPTGEFIEEEVPLDAIEPAGSITSEVQTPPHEADESDSGAVEPSSSGSSSGESDSHDTEPSPTAAEKREPVRPFADLPELPDDLADAFEQYKLAIISHRLSAWSEVSQDDVLASLDALRALALAPREEEQ